MEEFYRTIMESVSPGLLDCIREGELHSYFPKGIGFIGLASYFRRD
ncbi:hypothetical protein ACFL0X_01815 [Nanoarchaeota archaeon]